MTVREGPGYPVDMQELVLKGETEEIAPGRPLTAKQEAFAQYYVESRNATTAYRMAYDWDRAKGGEWLCRAAIELKQNPRIAARIEELRAEAARHTIIKAREVVGDWADQASTDANELTQVHTYNCRHCYGFEGRYQWRDEAELTQAMEMVQADIDRGVKTARMPDVLGGFGFQVRRPPNLDCVKCMGRGEVVVRFTDSDKLSTRARKLYKGARITRDGFELLVHDASDSRKELAKVLQLYGGSGLTAANPAAPVVPPAADVSEDEAARSYQAMIGQT